MHTATKVCPEALYPDYQELEGCWGLSPADHKVSRTPSYQDEDGNLYYVMSGQCSDALLNRAASRTVERPAHDTPDEEGSYQIDLVAAQRAADVVVVYSGAESLSGDTILAGVDLDPRGFIAELGLAPVPSGISL